MAEHDDTVQRKMLIMALIAIILDTIVGRSIGAVTHNAALGGLSFSLIFLWLRHQ